MREAVIFGAGNIGRGFIGQFYSEAGYRLVFVDVDTELIEHLNRNGKYTLQTVFNDECRDYTIGPVRALHGADVDSVATAVAAAGIAATAVGARALPHVAPVLAEGLNRRAAEAGPALNIILCENLKGVTGRVSELMEPCLDDVARDWCSQNLGLVEPVIGRMVPPLTLEMREQDPTLIRVEPYKELPVDRAGFKGEIPAIDGMEAHDNFEVFTARKLYVHNCGHALLGYSGYRYGYEFGWQALEDERVQAILAGGWQESRAGIVKEFGADPDWLDAHMTDLRVRFANRALGDSILRISRDPARKLAPADRLVAPARLAEKAGVTPEHLVTGIAMALSFDHPDDPLAAELQERIKGEGVEEVLVDVCGIGKDEPLGVAVAERYRSLAPE